MKEKIILITSLLTGIIFFGVSSCCKKTTTPVMIDPCSYNTDFVNINIPFTQTGATVLPPIINLVPAGVYADSVLGSKVPSTVESQVQNSGQYKTCQTQSIFVDQLQMIIDSPANQTFGFMDSINLFIHKKDGSNKLLIAKKGGVTASTKTITMDPVPVDIKSYVIADSFAFSIGIRKSSGSVINTVDPTYLRYAAGFKAKVFTK